MNENTTDPRVQTIENATRADVRPGDHITWERVTTIGGVTITTRYEGIAHHRDEEGDWWTREGMYITNGEDDATITIRRPIPDLPTEDGAVIIPADGHEYIQTRTGKKSRRLTWDADAFVWYDAHGTHLDTDITPGTWQVDDQ